MQNDILFDNIYIGHSIEDADKLTAESFKLKHPVEKALSEADKPKVKDEPKSPSDLKFLDDPVLYIREKVELFVSIAQNDPLEAVKFVPEVAAGFAAIVVALIAGVVALLGLGGSSPAVKETAAAAKDKAKEVKDKAAEVKDKIVEATDKGAEAAATGAEKAKGEATKRATRSQS